MRARGENRIVARINPLAVGLAKQLALACLAQLASGIGQHDLLVSRRLSQ